MNTPANILNSATLTATIAEAVGYNEIQPGTCLMVKLNDGTFELVPADRINARRNQGWIECVSSDTLTGLGIVGETSDEGLEEATKIADWMRAQA